jgi:hypothetical protein
LQREHVLTAGEFRDVFNTDISNCYKFLNKACKKLMKTSITLEKIELNEVWEINICSTAKYNKKEGCITVKFTDDIMPYLAQVRKRFILYNLKEIANFGSIYTTRLYISSCLLVKLVLFYIDTQNLLITNFCSSKSLSNDNKSTNNNFFNGTFLSKCYIACNH